MREGVIRIDVDEYRSGGSHVHMWVPAAAIPMAMHFVPDKHWRHASEHAREAMPILHAIVKELKKYPDAEFVQVDDGDEHVRVRTHEGKLQIDVDDPHEKVHVLCPLSTIEDVTSRSRITPPAHESSFGRLCAEVQSICEPKDCFNLQS